MLIDCGHNSSSGWRPSLYLPANGINAIDMLVVTNMDNDHVSDLPDLRQNVTINALTRNPSISPDALVAMKPDGVPPGIVDLTSRRGARRRPA
jgi:beta-lactamase superfamily II metal-dependent hydrolase